MAPKITLFFLQASRAIRTAWQLEELGLDYDVDFSEREDRVAPPAFRDRIGGLGKSPTLHVDGLSVAESGAIAEYLETHHDPTRKLRPADEKLEIAINNWVHAAEGTFMVHGLSIVYTRWFAPAEVTPGIEEKLAVNVKKDFAHLEEVLEGQHDQGRHWLVGESVSIADCMMQFSARLLLHREAGVKPGDYPAVDRWLAHCEASEGYKRAVAKTGFKL